jgi:hypothetical protein
MQKSLVIHFVLRSESIRRHGDHIDEKNLIGIADNLET